MRPDDENTSESAREESQLDRVARHAFTSFPDPVVVCALPDTGLLDANPAALPLLGLSLDQLSGWRLDQHLEPPPTWPDNPDPVGRLTWLTRPGHEPVAVEVHVSRVPGGETPLGLARIRPVGGGWLERLVAEAPALLAVHDSHGRLVHASPPGALASLSAGEVQQSGRTFQVEQHPGPEGLRLSIGVDVGGLEQTLQNERERAELYLMLLHSTEDFVGLVDPQERLLYVSPAFYRATGYTAAEVAATDWRTRVHPDDLPLVERTRQANLRGERTRIEYRCRCKNGSYLWLDLKASPIPGSSSRVERIVWSSRDITERKRLELELRESRRFIERVADTIPQMLFVYDLVENRHVWINARCLDVRGYTPGEMLRMGPGEAVGQIHPEDRLTLDEARGALASGPEGEVFEYRYRILHRQLGYRWVRTRCVVFRYGPDRMPTQVLGVSELAGEV